MQQITPAQWFYGIRVYIAIAIGLVSIETVWWSLSSYGQANLAAIRIEEIFAWLSVGLLASALFVGPTYKVFPNLAGKAMLRDARRMFGIGAAWFATLHASVAYIGQFQGANPLSLPSTYRWAFLWGGLALVILLALAFTSFNAAMRRMGKNWFRLHRLVYAAGFLALLHAFMIGVHASNPVPLIVLIVVVVLLIGLQLAASFTGHSPTRWQMATMVSSVIVLGAVFGFGVAHKHQPSTAAATANVPKSTDDSNMEMSPGMHMTMHGDSQ